MSTKTSTKSCACNALFQASTGARIDGFSFRGRRVFINIKLKHLTGSCFQI